MKLFNSFLIYSTISNDLEIKLNNQLSAKKRPSEFFERFEIEIIQEGIYLLTYNWIDRLKISEKYSKPIFNEVKSLYFSKYQRLAIFSDSESCITYFSNKFRGKYDAEIEKISYYDLWKKEVLNNKLLDNVLAVEIRNFALSDSPENVKKISGEKLNVEYLKYIIQSENEYEELVSVTLKSVMFDLTYYLDTSSVISLPDNIKSKNIINFICDLSKKTQS
ncbi:hypothetical protein ABE61_18755 [Lysinibacillus sphaericus]|uniref:hypothetical protein n=1 Tax=Lysinibacillus sphaericus TaxID=1421 RepID=UPI0018CF0D3A|nr:hypothetical protein [Lysinibacillus sphaericus]MBG9456027.1 hypothetical protein [Lysinibacillus sphaericus]MBG9479314.1 hypothetical protein [Lysinibacillus sphaericus]MBG9593431.1 hypothetical protein [Lysinibacillus sphaericus]